MILVPLLKVCHDLVPPLLLSRLPGGRGAQKPAHTQARCDGPEMGGLPWRVIADSDVGVILIASVIGGDQRVLSRPHADHLG